MKTYIKFNNYDVAVNLKVKVTQTNMNLGAITVILKYCLNNLAHELVRRTANVHGFVEARNAP